MPPTPVQGNSATSGGTTVSVAWPASTTNGNYLVATVGADTTLGAVTPPIPSGFASSPWTQRGTTHTNGSGASVAEFECINALPQNTVAQTWTIANSVNSVGVCIEEYSGIPTTPPHDGTDAANTGTGSPITGGAITTTVTGDLVLAAACQATDTNGTAIAWTQSGSWVIRQQVGFHSVAIPCAFRLGILEQVVGGAGSYTPTVTSSAGSDPWVCLTTALMPASGGPTVVDEEAGYFVSTVNAW